MWNVECGMWNVACGRWHVEGGRWKVTVCYYCRRIVGGSGRKPDDGRDTVVPAN